MPNLTIFLSHIHEEAELASRIKHEIETMFLRTVEVFVSSDRRSIRAGQQWLKEISDALNRSGLYFALCSPASITRHWIFFECGAGWLRGCPTIPLCHSGLSRGDLPPPLSFLQAIELTEPADLDHVVDEIAQLAGVGRPPTDVPAFVEWLNAWSGDRAARLPAPTANETLPQKERKVAAKNMLGRLIKEGEALSLPAPIEEMTANANRWGKQAGQFVATAFGDGEAEMLFSDAGYVFHSGNGEVGKGRNWIIGRLRRLIELMQRVDHAELRADFDPRAFE